MSRRRTDRLRSRRAVLSAAAAGAVGAAVPGAVGRAAEPAAGSATAPATGPASRPAATRPGVEAGIGAGGDAAVDAAIGDAGRLFGRDYSGDAVAQLRPGLVRAAGWLKGLRERDVPAGVEPAVTFDPSPPAEPPVAGAVGAALPAGESSVDAGDDVALAFAPVADLARLLRAGRVTSARLTDLALDRLRRHGPELECVVTLTEDLARRQAARADADLAAGRDRGPLHGIPYGAKDLLAVAGYPTTYGAAPYRQQAFDRDATVIRRLAEAGAVLVAKLTLGELAMGDVWFGGRTRNPWALDEGSGGSSAGSCAAVAAGLVPFAIGSETLGSIVHPCTICGTCGLRPTFGRVPRTGAMPLARTLDKLGPIARRVDDLAFVLAAIAGADGDDPTTRDAGFAFPHDAAHGPVRVGYDALTFEAMEKRPEDGDDADEVRAVKQLYRDALARCRAMFGEVVAVRLPHDEPLWPLAIVTIEVESAESFSELSDAGRLGELRQQGEGNWPTLFRRGALIPAVDYLRAQRVRRQVAARAVAAVGDVDAVLTIPQMGQTLALTNLTGHPTCVARLGVVGGRPRQVEFVGRHYGEGRLLSAASAFEATVDARDEWPRGRWA